MTAKVLVFVLLLLSLPAAAQHHHHPAAALAAPSKIEDVPVVTQDGAPARFYSDLVKGRVTAIQFVFTSCTTVCPLMGVRFAQLQSRLGSDAARVSLLSVSIDPANDTPQRLAAWSKRVGAKPGWTLVTGTKPDMDRLLQSLGASSADPAAHTPLVLIVDDRAADGEPSMLRLDGLADPTAMAAAIRKVISSR